MSERRVLHVLEATRGGTRTHILDLLFALAARGWTCGLAYSSSRNPDFIGDARRLNSLGVATWDIPMRRGPHPGDALALRDLLAIARSFGPRLLHAHSSKAGLLARLAAPMLRVPAVYTPHCVAFETSLPRSQRRLARWGEIALAPFTARMIAVSQTERRALLRVLPIAASRVALIRNGVDASRFDTARESPSDASSTALTIGCFGRLSAQKNQIVLLHALKLLCSSGVEARLLIVGGGEDEAMLHEASRRLGVADQVEWTGEVSDASGFYDRCDAVALPSRWEGCPYSLLEAMAARRAVVASNIAPLREILRPPGGPCGVLCPARAEDFAHALAELAHDSSWREMLGQKARARIESGFTLERMARETERVYHQATS